MAHLSLSLLGPFQVTLDGQPVTGFKSNKVRALLAYLAVEADRPHRREVLAGLLWPDWPDRDALSNLRYALSNLRRVIGDRQAEPPFLLITRDTLQFNTASDYWLDVTAFTEMVEADKTHPSAIDQLGQAVALYRGSFLEGLSVGDSPAFEEWALFTRERLARQMSSTLHRLAATYERRGQYEQAQSCAWRQVQLEPWDEVAHGRLMRTLALSGQRGAALVQYETCRRLLAEELGVEPAAETTRLYEQIQAGELMPPVPDAPKHNLPVQTTPFVGRETELAELARLLANPGVRLLTILGAGGMGKTRLALEAGVAQLNNFECGVFFVSLAPLRSVDAIVPTVANAIGFSFYRGREPRQQLLDYLRQKSMLLIMDNFEHLLDGVDLVSDVLKTAPDVKILTTSRAKLNVGGEQRFQIVGIECPDWETPGDAADSTNWAEYSAVKLFLQGARRARPDFELEADDFRYVSRICRLVQGMPLGILLAAAWVEMLTLEEIAAEIGRSLDFLETDLCDVPQRQRSIRAVFDHSWSLLTERQREVLQGLSVFRGGFTRQAAQRVTGASLSEMKGLMDRSLVQRVATGRYDVHELLRQYAAEKLEQSPAANEAARDRHCAYYTAALQSWEADLKGPQQVAALAEMDVEIENARGAWNWAVEQGQVGRLDRAIFGLCQYYTLRGRLQECGAACEAAAQRLEGMMSGDTPVLSKAEGLRVLARVLKWQGGSIFSLGRYEAGQQLVQQSLTLLDAPALAGQDIRAERASILGAMSRMVFYTEGVQARQLIEERLALYQELGDRWGVAQVLGLLASLAFWRGDLDEAKRQSEEFLALCQELGDQQRIGAAYGDLGNVARARGELDKAEHLCRKAIKILREIQQPHSLRWAQWYLSLTFMLAGKFAQARALMEESLASFGYLGDKCVADNHAVLGFVEMSLGDHERARAQGETSLALARRSRNHWSIALSLFVLGCVALVEGESGLDAGTASHVQNAGEAREAYAEAQRLSQESVAIYREMDSRLWLGIPLAVLGVAARALGDIDRAQRHLYEALRIASDIGAFWPLMLAVPATALVLADVGEHERAVELYALASRYPLVGKSRWFEDVFGRHIAAVAATLPPDVVAAAQERGRAREMDATVAELLAELGA